ncbi:MAG: phosphotransferase [Turneriella sp.]|nr:phosphotransferase [Turneriella sp.]
MQSIPPVMGDLFSQALTEAGFRAPLVKASALVAEASARRYFRLVLADGSSVVAAIDGSQEAQRTSADFLAIRQILARCGVAVPQVYYYNGSNLFLLQDLGDDTLAAGQSKDPSNREQLYYHAIDQMLRWQSAKDDGQCPAFRRSFDYEKLYSELEFFIENTVVGYWGKTVGRSELCKLYEAFSGIAAKLAEVPNKVLSHRDYHSRNIMLCTENSAVRQYVIDFQDARLGLFQYDLVSLLFDAYCPLPQALRKKLLEYAYLEGKKLHQQSAEEFSYYVSLSAYQRLLKAMGTFGYQALRGRSDYAACLKPAWQLLGEACEDFVELRSIYQQIESLR